MKKILISTLAILLFVTGCKQIPKLENGQEAVVTLSSGNISVDDLYDKVKMSYALNSLLELMDTKMLAEEYGKDLSTDEKNQINSQIDYWKQIFGGESEMLQQTAQYFGASTLSELNDYLSLQYRRNKVVEDYSKKQVTDSEIQKFYDEVIFGDIEASHILIEPEVTDSMTTEEKSAKEEEALKLANEIITKLNNGEKFEDLAKEYSDDEDSKNDGGSIGYFTHGKSFSDEFEEAAKKLENGKYTTTPVKSSYGYHIILRTNSKEKPSLDSIKSDIVDEIAAGKLEENKDYQIKALEDLRKKYKMEIQDSELKTQYENYIKNSYASLEEK